jgi:carboxyvinyl-carboxyphosphonate phosphorylmutase
VSALTIEDSVLPTPFGGQDESLVSVEEMVGKLRAAVAARRDPALVVLGRTTALRHGGLPEASRRLRAYEDTGIDGIFIVGAQRRQEIQSLREATRLPLLLGSTPPELADRDFLAAHGVRIALQGHHPFYAAARAVYDTLKYLREGGAPAGLKDRVASEDLLRIALRQDEYERRQSDYLR